MCKVSLRSGGEGLPHQTLCMVLMWIVIGAGHTEDGGLLGPVKSGAQGPEVQWLLNTEYIIAFK